MVRKKVKDHKNPKDYVCKRHDSCSCGAGYGLGFVGALVYYISHATGFWVGVLGVLKAIVWPAMLVYEVLNYLGM